eukprot:8513891-Lingulodinium_polyedra.AAC.1
MHFTTPCLNAPFHNGDARKRGDCLLQQGEGLQNSASHEIVHFSAQRCAASEEAPRHPAVDAL